IRTALGSDLVSETPGSATFFHSITNDSRIAQRGQLFVALRTEERDGHAFVADAVSKDVAGVIIEAQSDIARAAIAELVPEALEGRGAVVSPASGAPSSS